MKKLVVLGIALMLPGLLGSGVAFAEEHPHDHAGHNHVEATQESASFEAAEKMNYVCPMHSDVQSDKPGECPKCGMTLKQAAHEEVGGEESHEGHSHKH